MLRRKAERKSVHRPHHEPPSLRRPVSVLSIRFARGAGSQGIFDSVMTALPMSWQN